MKRLTFIIFLLIFLIHSTKVEVFAQNFSSGLATYVSTVEKNVQDGDIIKYTEKGYALANNAYEPSIFGVIVANPAISLEANSPNTHAVVSNGKAYIRVSTINGPIKKGDLITSSNLPGVGQKATESGYVIGTALADYSASDSRQIGKILVQLNLTFNSTATTAGSNLIELLRVGLSTPYISPLNTFRYLLAAGVIILAFIMAVRHFGKIAITGIESIGRNPLASKLITVNVVLNVIFGIGMVFTSLTLAYFILII